MRKVVVVSLILTLAGTLELFAGAPKTRKVIFPHIAENQSPRAKIVQPRADGCTICDSCFNEETWETYPCPPCVDHMECGTVGCSLGFRCSPTTNPSVDGCFAGNSWDGCGAPVGGSLNSCGYCW